MRQLKGEKSHGDLENKESGVEERSGRTARDATEETEGREGGRPSEEKGFLGGTPGYRVSLRGRRAPARLLASPAQSLALPL